MLRQEQDQEHYLYLYTSGRPKHLYVYIYSQLTIISSLRISKVAWCVVFFVYVAFALYGLWMEKKRAFVFLECVCVWICCSFETHTLIELNKKGIRNEATLHVRCIHKKCIYI